MERKFTKGAEASAILGVSQNTLRSYANSGKISCVTLPSGQRRYDVTSLMKKENKPNRKCVCYCRVSTHGQRDDLER
jgi:putative resolvase